MPPLASPLRSRPSGGRATSSPTSASSLAAAPAEELARAARDLQDDGSRWGRRGKWRRPLHELLPHQIHHVDTFSRTHLLRLLLLAPTLCRTHLLRGGMVAGGGGIALLSSCNGGKARRASPGRRSFLGPRRAPATTTSHYVKTSNRPRSICSGPLTPVTCTHICNECCLASVTHKSTRTTPGLASTTPVTNVDFW
jgi:hypothetical protein